MCGFSTWLSQTIYQNKLKLLVIRFSYLIIYTWKWNISIDFGWPIINDAKEGHDSESWGKVFVLICFWLWRNSVYGKEMRCWVGVWSQDWNSKELTGLHKRWCMWFNSIQHAKLYQLLTYEQENMSLTLTFIQVQHNRRQLVAWDIWSSPTTRLYFLFSFKSCQRIFKLRHFS